MKFMPVVSLLLVSTCSVLLSQAFVAVHAQEGAPQSQRGAQSTQLAQAPAPNAPQAAVAYPDGFRTWSNVKSGMIGPKHKAFAANGGFTHIYANTEAMTGYRTRQFPQGSIIVFEWLEMREQADGSIAEGPRRQVDVMVKDAQRYASSGDWGFQRFVKDSKTELAASPTPEACLGCHDKLKKDGLVLSSYRQ